MIDTDYKGRCPACGSPSFVVVSLNGGLTHVPQCVPCGALHQVTLPREPVGKPSPAPYAPERPVDFADFVKTAHVVDKLARWFAVEIAGNEIQFIGAVFPALFRKLVAHYMVSDRKLGWPDTESSEAYLHELYKWDDE